MAVRTYDPAAVSVLIGGVPMSGFADGTFVTVTRDNDTFTKVAGADGVTSRAKNTDKSGTMTLVLAMTSPSNDALQIFADLDELSSTGIVPILVKDNSGRSVHFAANAWVKKAPSAEYGKEISNREWILDLADYIPHNAGNANFEPA